MSDDERAASGTGRAVPWLLTRPVLLSPIQLGPVRVRQLYQPWASTPTTFSSDEYDDETHEEDLDTPTPAGRAEMDVYSPGGYVGDINTSSEVDDDMDFYEVESSQPPVAANAVRFSSPSHPIQRSDPR